MTSYRTQEFGGDWTAEKLDRIRKYLSAYTTALKNKPFRLQYIDAFAGTGYCGRAKMSEPTGRLFPDLAATQTQEFLKGSARIALETEPPFGSFLFIDNDPEKCAQLDRLKIEFPGKAASIDVVNEDANVSLQRLATQNWRGRRAVLFLDPYGMQVAWETVQAVARTQAIDMWYLFPLSANRLLRTDANLSESWRQRLNVLFGSDDWEQAFYDQQVVHTLFGEDESIVKTDKPFEAIKDYLLSRLRGEFVGVAENPLVLRTSGNSPLFLLCFAAANPVGAKTAVRIAQDILGRRRNGR